MDFVPEPLNKLYTIQSLYGRRQVPTEDIIVVLQGIVAHFDNTFFLIDGLDEIPDDQKQVILSFIAHLKDWSRSQIHVFVTSRSQDLGLFRITADYTTDLSDNSSDLLEEKLTYVMQQLDQASYDMHIGLSQAMKDLITDKIVLAAHER